jgi:RND family efflux transporter MFP subunit
MTGVPAKPGSNLKPEFPMPSNFLRSRPALISTAVLILAAAAVATGVASRRSHAEQLQQSAAERAIPTVALLSPSSSAAAALELPARIEAWSRAPIYARVSGYLQRWTVDIGAPVKAGQLLAQIDTPDLDQQLRQGQAELATARSNVTLAASTAQRWQTLLPGNAVSKQAVDEKLGDLAAKQSVVQAMQANVERLLAMQRYTRLVAPFDGVVTARNTDVGALINVGGAPGSELFVVSDIRRLRVYVNVPQRQVAQVHPGSRAQITVPERTGRTYTATVQSLAHAINAASGTMLVELAVDNKAGELLPGAFATARFDIPAGDGSVGVPPGALIVGKNGVQVATVDSGNHVRLKQVTIARDLGDVVQLAGVAPGARLIANPPDGVADGDVVRIATVTR